MVISIVAKDTPRKPNRIELDNHNKDRHGVPGVKVTYSLDDNTKKLMIHGMAR